MANGPGGFAPNFLSAPQGQAGNAADTAPGATPPGLLPPAGASGTPRDVRVTINVAQPAGGNVPQSLERSSRQIASAVRRAVGGF